MFCVFNQNRCLWRLLWGWDGSTYPVAASSGFQCSPGCAPLGNVPRVIPLAGYVGEKSTTCRRQVEMWRNFDWNACRGRHILAPTQDFVSGIADTVPIHQKSTYTQRFTTHHLHPQPKTCCSTAPPLSCRFHTQPAILLRAGQPTTVPPFSESQNFVGLHRVFFWSLSHHCTLADF